MSAPPWLARIVLVSCASGCAVSAGTATVGIWRPKRVVDTVVCIESAPGVCGKTIEVGRDVPARSFGGGMLSFFNPGYMHVSGASANHRVALASHYDYLRGRGAFALGGRIGADIGLNFGPDRSNLLFTVPVSVIGYWGSAWGSLYGGVGYTPYGSERADVGDTRTRAVCPASTCWPARACCFVPAGPIGSRSARSLRQYLGGTRVTSSTANIGLHF